MVVFLSDLLVVSNNKRLTLCIQIAVILCLILGYGYDIYCQARQCYTHTFDSNVPRKIFDISGNVCIILVTVIAILSIFKLSKIINGLLKPHKPSSLKHSVWVKIWFNLRDALNWIGFPLLLTAFTLEFGWNRGCLMPMLVVHFFWEFMLIRILFMSNMITDHFVKINNLLFKQETKVVLLKVKTVAIIEHVQVNNDWMHLRYLETLEHITEQFHNLCNDLDSFNAQLKYLHVLNLIGTIIKFLMAWIDISQRYLISKSAYGFWSIIIFYFIHVNNFVSNLYIFYF